MTKGKFLDDLGEQLCMRTRQEVGCLVWGRCSVQLCVTVLAELSGLSFANEMGPVVSAITNNLPLWGHKCDLYCGHVCTCPVLPKGPKSQWEVADCSLQSLPLAIQSG